MYIMIQPFAVIPNCQCSPEPITEQTAATQQEATGINTNYRRGKQNQPDTDTKLIKGERGLLKRCLKTQYTQTVSD